MRGRVELECLFIYFLFVVYLECVSFYVRDWRLERNVRVFCFLEFIVSIV